MAVQPQEALRPLSVLELNTRLHELLAVRYQSVLVKGEVSGVSLSGGHVWFVLKDPGARLEAVIFSSTARRLPFLPQDGQELVVTGQIDFHVQTGRMKLVVARVDYDGAGKMREAIDRLKRRLESEGAFEPARKRPLPFLPRCVALITSPSGAVIHDLQQTVWERFPNMSLVLYATQVQGTASQRSLVAALRQCDRDRAADVCIVARGGGSLEELMAFNQEPVVRAIQAMRMPVVTALGHTSDRTLADLVADREARTPTAAAELVVPRKRDLIGQLRDRGDRLRRAADMVLLAREQALTRRLAGAPVLQDPLRLLLVPARHDVAQREQALGRLEREAMTRRHDRLDDVMRHLARRNPLEVLRQRLRGLDERRQRLARSMEQAAGFARREQDRVQGLRARMRSSLERTVRELDRGLVLRAHRLRSLGTQETLDRGFSICRDSEGRVVRDSDQVGDGQPLSVTLARGMLDCRIERVTT
jgi:exodeoxyribonuclease VII large subunit